MSSIQDVKSNKLVETLAEELQATIKAPEWASFVKTGVNRERPPEQKNWWHLRAASILRRIYLDGPVGTQRLRTYYGGLHRRGHKPAHFARGSGKVIRVLLQDLEKAGYIKKEKKGRSITGAGVKLLNSAARKLK
ncbi:MAG: 30S ribosomal protein S19e [Candidatus Aenigmarchaeota archaeon]|nr:30S ribosomal protein S19e [Candidatus Aenigmarchaeota archaeon]